MRLEYTPRGVKIDGGIVTGVCRKTVFGKGGKPAYDVVTVWVDADPDAKPVPEDPPEPDVVVPAE